jgi:hypothetical protein
MQPASHARPARCLPVRLPLGILIRAARTRIKANGPSCLRALFHLISLESTQKMRAAAAVGKLNEPWRSLFVFICMSRSASSIQFVRERVLKIHCIFCSFFSRRFFVF